MTTRTTKPPKDFAKPAHWDNSPPPEPGEPDDGMPDPDGLSPTRFGDWVKNGVAVDF